MGDAASELVAISESFPTGLRPQLSMGGSLGTKGSGRDLVESCGGVIESRTPGKRNTTSW